MDGQGRSEGGEGEKRGRKKKQGRVKAQQASSKRKEYEVSCLLLSDSSPFANRCCRLLVYLITLVRSTRKKEQGSQEKAQRAHLLIILVINCLDTRQDLSTQASLLCLVDFDRTEEESSSLTRQKSI